MCVCERVRNVFIYIYIYIYIYCDVICYRESELEVNTLTPHALNQQALRMKGREGPTIKVVGERNGKQTISLAL